MIAVWDPTAALATAVAELPISVRASSQPSGAIAVVPGRGWTTGIVEAVDAGVLAILIVDPGPATAAALAEVPRAALDLPVVVLRRRLAPGRMPAATGAVAAVVAECAAPARMLPAALRDAIGWARTVAGSSIELQKTGRAAGGRIASLSSAEGSAVSVVSRALSGVPDGALIRVTSLGPVRREAVVDEPAGVLRITVADEHGVVQLAGGLESPEREALRRIVAALDGDGHPDDLAELIHDVVIADAILAARDKQA